MDEYILVERAKQKEADAIQDTILTCWEKLSDLRNVKYFKTWMIRILINNCYKLIRNNRKITYMEDIPEDMSVAETDDLCWKEALRSMDEKYRIVVILFYVEGFRTKEISKILGIPDSTVRTRLARGRIQLTRYYKE